MASSWVLIAFFAVIVALVGNSRLRDHGLNGRHWMLLRALFPSWRFFEELDQIPKLRFRVGHGPWRDCFGSEPRGIANLFLNARGNLRMAGQSLVEQLTTDVAEAPEGAAVEDSVSYALTVRLVRSKLLELGAARPGERFQFKVTFLEPGAREREAGEDMLLSAEHEV